jgi:hypothetical protein
MEFEQDANASLEGNGDRRDQMAMELHSNEIADYKGIDKSKMLTTIL